MTDNQLDTLLRRALRPEENPPELIAAKPRQSRTGRRAFLFAAACLCVCVCAGVFLRYGMMQSKEAAREDAMAGSAWMDPEFDGLLADKAESTVDGSKNNTAASEGQNSGAHTEPTEPSAVPEKPQASPLDAAVAAFMKSLDESSDSSVPVLTQVGHSEPYYSMMLTTDGAVAYFTVNSSTGAVVSLSDLLNDAALEFVAETHPEAHKLAQEEAFYVNNGQVIVFKGKIS